MRWIERQRKNKIKKDGGADVVGKCNEQAKLRIGRKKSVEALAGELLKEIEFNLAKRVEGSEKHNTDDGMGGKNVRKALD